MHQTGSRKKLFVTLGGIAVFVIGAVLGSLLVLSANTSEGKSFFIENTPSTYGHLPQRGPGTPVPAVENYTEEFSSKLLRSTPLAFAGAPEETIDKLLSQDVGPLISARLQEISRPPQGFTVNISGKIQRDAYLRELGPRVAFLMDVFFELTAQDVRTLGEKSVQDHFGHDIELIEEMLADLENMAVPPKYKGLHIDVAAAAHGLKLTLTSVTAIRNDPARALLLPASVDSLIEQFNRILDQLS